MSDAVRLQRRQPTRLCLPWDSPGKNTGVGCHFLLQCMQVKSENEVAQSCPTLSDPMDCSPPGSSIHGIFQARVLECSAIAFSEHSHWPIAILVFLYGSPSSSACKASPHVLFIQQDSPDFLITQQLVSKEAKVNLASERLGLEVAKSPVSLYSREENRLYLFIEGMRAACVYRLGSPCWQPYLEAI